MAFVISEMCYAITLLNSKAKIQQDYIWILMLKVRCGANPFTATNHFFEWNVPSNLVFDRKIY